MKLLKRITRRWLEWRACVALDNAMQALERARTAEARLVRIRKS